MKNGSVADAFAPVLGSLAAVPLRVRFWDGSELGRADAGTTYVLSSPAALTYLAFGRGQLGIARAYVSGELSVEGDLYTALDIGNALRTAGERDKTGFSLRDRLRLLAASARVGALHRPPAPPPEEIRLRGRLHSKSRDAVAISHHYDISNDFYRTILGETMVYSCGYFARDAYSLDEAQLAKCDLICNKLSLGPDDRLLDVGCGWGTMVIHAARHYGARCVGVTISREQAELARERVVRAGLSDRIEIRVQDYRDVDDGPYDAISSIGMFEHVGLDRLREYFTALLGQLKVGGRLMNHGISRPNASQARTRFAKNSFIEHYVFPDGELLEVGAVVSIMQACGLEVRDVESLREHYARTLRAWTANLDEHLEQMCDLVGANRARVWRLYMAASALNFAANRTAIHQVLAVHTGPRGDSAMPATRAAFAVREEAVLASS